MPEQLTGWWLVFRNVALLALMLLALLTWKKISGDHEIARFRAETERIIQNQRAIATAQKEYIHAIETAILLAGGSPGSAAEPTGAAVPAGPAPSPGK
ncbi:MAG: hypothetical protein KQJ78_11115 [Deltaproteobacteria bacterium]|nr:hypothetical protein [Deltaproteobacteria bacterium]